MKELTLKPREKETKRQERLIRFETAQGEGIFQAGHDFLDLVTEPRSLRSRTKLTREMTSLLTWIRNHTNPPPRSGYSDWRCRYLCTWFKESAVEHLRRAERLCTILQREGVNIRRIEITKPIQSLWEDDVQVITRRPRQPQEDAVNIFEARVRNRIAKQKRRRLRAGRIRARAYKSGI